MGYMRILKPEIVETNNGVRLQTIFEIEGRKDVLWYEVDKEYGNYLTSERADAFVIGLLFLALQKGVNIKVDYHMSKRLNYSLNTYFIPFLAQLFNCNTINIHCEYLTSEILENSGGVGTGLSCGVDTFSTIYDHEEKRIPEDYEITHFTYFNVGSHGDYGGKEAKILFMNRFNNVKSCANELGKKMIKVDSNLNEKLHTGFSKLHTLRSMSVVLALQKLFRVYYYSSAVSVEDFKINKHHMGSYDIFSLNMLSTESVSLFSSCATLTRLEKTRLISKYPLVKRYLNVCVLDEINCGKCFKCLRTLLTLEILGEINEFSENFNLEEFYKAKPSYLVEVIAHHDKDIFMKEIYEEMKRINFKVCFKYRLIGKLKRIKSKSKKAFTM